MSPFWAIGTLFGASSVMLGAFGAHGLKKRIADPARITNWSTAAQYQVRLSPLHTPLPALLSLPIPLPSPSGNPQPHVTRLHPDSTYSSSTRPS
jgi:hypothetical protein